MQAMWFSEIFSFAGWLDIAVAKVFSLFLHYFPYFILHFNCQDI